MFNDLSDRVQAIKPSPTLAVSALATQLRSQGRDIIGLGTGEPDFDTPEHIKQAAIEAIHNGQTKYTAVDGTIELKQAIINKFERDNNFQYQPQQILVSSGGKQSFYNLCQALLNKGDEVIIPAPYWVSYPDMVILAEAKPVIIETTIEQQFKINADSLKQAITDKTRMLVINSPSNPSGVAYSKKELESIAEVLLDHPDILVVTDDMYEHIIWNDEGFSNILNACSDLYGRCMVLNGVSKAYAMTGWRIGYAAGPEDIIKAMKKIQSQSTSNPCSISQAAAIAALDGDQSCIHTMLSAFKERHDFVVDSVNTTPNMSCTPSDGTFYSFVNIQPFIDSRSDLSSDVEVANLLLDKVGVALVPGSAFGSPGHMRLSFATSMQNLQSAMERINQVFSEK
ncbi:MAG: pyridoxal phosphate-dependent aminotransferase [Gammaproteobacteria bacterium]|mgnify:FL=1|nr:pyridoxal phosphate-dependent aminotransferase [Gammaproteobacteria bacterium]MBT3723982.1 pyridoxal phosphate-dependent aminotransferase [Gammaproteobacteria bacterium]MBT4451246.1 pyridoxal phosphate-dependent aminotransferase [Gammaproteobacteria bacterium]MBT6701838.1 pyridoxal phosphate-dependent aminotransferase [Gammaproteobacteria bacterium]MBT7043815.1 pyridoxal phosphate-dependent aminotransferase [Gammaproteobacteria bacterium]